MREDSKQVVEEAVALETYVFDTVGVTARASVVVERIHSSRNVDQYPRMGDKYFS